LMMVLQIFVNNVLIPVWNVLRLPFAKHALLIKLHLPAIVLETLL
jgi:hypothetical protein